MLQTPIGQGQDNVDGVVRLELCKGSARVVGRKSPRGLYNLARVTFEEDAVYNQRDAEGFINLSPLRLRLAATGAHADTISSSRLWVTFTQRRGR
jgi:argininosuccinate synthase